MKDILPIFLYQENYEYELDIYSYFLAEMDWNFIFMSGLAPEYPFGI